MEPRIGSGFFKISLGIAEVKKNSGGVQEKTNRMTAVIFEKKDLREGRLKYPAGALPSAYGGESRNGKRWGRENRVSTS